ncbi:MAG: hypothetical protein K8R21_04605, partial [Leptospira sp.]|nr:hypothetical protein [Leptospira sp.]
MKCYVTFDLLKELIYGKEDLAAEIENHIIGFLKKEIPVCTSSLSLGRIIEAEKNQVHSGIILSQSEILFSEIFSFSTRDIRLGINIEKDYQLGRFAL